MSIDGIGHETVRIVHKELAVKIAPRFDLYLACVCCTSNTANRLRPRRPALKELTRLIVQEHFPNAKAQIIPGAGHWLHAEKPAIFNGIIKRFLEQQL